MRSWAIFEGPLQQALHRIKYKQDIALAEYFARYLMTLLMDQAWSIDLVAPVPIGKKRKKQRGYNQAGLLAKPLALGLDLFYRP
ncbi:MAG: ComF family protein, partial [Chloroflexota bacterium]|nr:ComF family protein [Chloroflexota bacterium]